MAVSEPHHEQCFCYGEHNILCHLHGTVHNRFWALSPTFAMCAATLTTLLTTRRQVSNFLDVASWLGFVCPSHAWLLACLRSVFASSKLWTDPNFQEFRLAYWSGSTQKKNEKKCKNIRIWSQKVFCTSNMFRKFSALVYQFLKKIFQYFFKKRREYFFWNQTKYKGP